MLHRPPAAEPASRHGGDGRPQAAAPQPDASAAHAAAAAPPSTRAALETLGRIAAPATVLTALLYYFGWLQARGLALGVGIDPDVLDYTTQDYLLRSVDALFVPLAMLCVAVLICLWLHGVLMARVVARDQTALLTRLAVGIAVAGVVLLVAATVARLRPAGLQVAGFEVAYAPWAPRWAPPLGIVLGVALIDYAAQLRRRLVALRGAASDTVPQTPRPSATERAALGGLLLLGLFWSVTIYAQAVGNVRLDGLRHDTSEWSELPTVVLYSQQDLVLDAPGVTVGRCTTIDAAYGFRYTGLRLFAYSNDKYFLLPTDWPENRGPAIVVPDDPALRVELLPGTDDPGAASHCPPA